MAHFRTIQYPEKALVLATPDTGGVGESAKPVGFPDDLGRALDVLSTRARVAVLLALREHGPSTPIQLAEWLGVTRTLVRHHLLALEQLGILDIHPPRAETDVRKRYFSINEAALAFVLDAVWTHVAGHGDRAP